MEAFYMSDTGFFEATYLFESLRHGDFDISSALGELIDNSIEAGTERIEIDFVVEKAGEEEQVKCVQIVDYGCGMSYSELQNSLKLGKQARGIESEHPIGKFGVGLTLGAITIGRRIDITSKKDNLCFGTYLDLDEIKTNTLQNIPLPTKRDIVPYSTNVTISKCDRLNADPVKNIPVNPQVHITDFKNYASRVYRRFLNRGLEIFVNGEKLEAHDILTFGKDIVDVDRTQSKYADLPKDKSWSVLNTKIPIVLEAKTHYIDIQIALLAEELRTHIGAGGTLESKELKITENEGISILRADREVMYFKLPYLIGKKGSAKYLNIDRFWSMEISFTPDLDEYFHVKYIKRGVEPVKSLKEQIRDIVTPTVIWCRNEIRRIFKENRRQIQNDGVILPDLKVEVAINAVSFITDDQLEKILNQAPSQVEEFSVLNINFKMMDLDSDQIVYFDEKDNNICIVLNTTSEYINDFRSQEIFDEDESASSNDGYIECISLLFSAMLKNMIDEGLKVEDMNKRIREISEYLLADYMKLRGIRDGK